MKKIAVIGAGTMGNGIAHVFAQSGFEVSLIDISQNSPPPSAANVIVKGKSEGKNPVPLSVFALSVPFDVIMSVLSKEKPVTPPFSTESILILILFLNVNVSSFLKLLPPATMELSSLAAPI